MKYFIIIISIFIFYTIDDAASDSIIDSSKCIIGLKNAQENNVITVRPLGEACFNNCQEYCAEKFKLNNSDNNSQLSINDSIFKDQIFITNRDRIEQCLSKCFSSERFDTKIRIPSKIDTTSGSVADAGNNPYPWLCDIKSNASQLSELHCGNQSDEFPSDIKPLCSKSDKAISYYDGNILFHANDQVVITLSDKTSDENSTLYSYDLLNVQGNTIYLCGFESTFYSPIFYTMDGKKIIGNDPVNAFDSALSNNLNLHNIQSNSLLEIMYMGTRYYKKTDRESGANFYALMTLLYGGNNAVMLTRDYIPYNVNDYSDSAKRKIIKECEVCLKDSSNVICKSANCQSVKTNIHTTTDTFDITTNVSWLTTPTIFIPPKTSTDTYSQFRQTNISVFIKNIPSVATLHLDFDRGQEMNLYGGYFVSMSKKGCRYINGERLQYAIVNSVLTDSRQFSQYLVWRDLVLENDRLVLPISQSDIDVPYSALQDSSIASELPHDKKDYTGKIFFRIKPAYANIDNLIGQYYLKVYTITNHDGVLNAITNMFTKTLIGIPETIFNAFVKNMTYINIVRLSLVFYIAFMGLSFLIGTAQITQKEGVTRIFKIGIVVLLLGESSFDIFNNYLFKFFDFDIMNMFINVVTPDIRMHWGPELSIDSVSCFENPDVKIKMMCLLEQDLKLFFQMGFWNRIIGLMISGLFVPAIAVTVGVIIYFSIILKVTFLYCIALLCMTITISLAPIFIPLILFNYTRSFFDAWIKQLMAFLMQPMFIFVTLALFRIVFIAAVQSLIGVASCKTCWLQFGLPGIGNFCLFGVYVPLSLASVENSIGNVPISQIGMFLSIYFIANSMYLLCTFSSDMANRLLSFSLFNITQTNVGVGTMYDDAKKFSSMTYDAATSGADVLGIDEKSVNKRRK